MKKLKPYIVEIILALSIIAVFSIFGVFWKEMVEAISHANLWMIFLATLSFFGLLGVWCIRWKMFLKKQIKSISVKELFPILLVGISINNLTPVARAGGEPVRAYLVKVKKGVSLAKTLAATIAEMLPEVFSQIFTVVFSFAIAMLFFTLPLWLQGVFAVFVILSFGVCSGIFFFANFNPENPGKLVRFVQKVLKERFASIRKKLEKWLGKFHFALKYSIEDKVLVLKSLGISLLLKCFDMLRIFLIFEALGYRVTPVFLIVFLGIYLALLSVPLTPGAMGIAEGGSISVLLLLGVPASIAAAFVAIERAITFWLPTVMGIAIACKYGINIRQEIRKIGVNK